MLAWLKNFDMLKAALLTVVAVLSSWYDLRGEVKMNRAEVDTIKQTSQLRWETQAVVDANQNKAINDLHEDLKDGFKDIKEAIRARR